LVARAWLVASLPVLIVAGCGGTPENRDRAIEEAKAVFAAAKSEGADLEAGPCIAEELPGAPGWVADVAHDPREDVDDDPANQCVRFRDGKATHFVELSPEGELIRAE
jgi:hypothetical protein